MQTGRIYSTHQVCFLVIEINHLFLTRHIVSSEELKEGHQFAMEILTTTSPIF